MDMRDAYSYNILVHNAHRAVNTSGKDIFCLRFIQQSLISIENAK